MKIFYEKTLIGFRKYQIHINKNGKKYKQYNLKKFSYEIN